MASAANRKPSDRWECFTTDEIFVIDLALHHRVYSVSGPRTKERLAAEMALRKDVRHETDRRRT